MKQLFIRDLSNPDECSYKDFLVGSADKERKEKIKSLENEILEQAKKAELPKWASLLSIILLGLTAVFLFGAIEGCLNAGYETARQNGFLIFIFAGLCCLAGAFFIYIIKKGREKRVVNDAEFSQKKDLHKRMIKFIQDELGVPENAPRIDIFCKMIKSNKGKERRVGLFEFVNCEFIPFVEKETICFACGEEIIGIKKDELVSIEKINKRTSLCYWNKGEMFNSPKYKEFKILPNLNTGTLSIKNYYKVLVKRDEQEYEFLVPNYDIATFLQVTGMTVTNNDSTAPRVEETNDTVEVAEKQLEEVDPFAYKEKEVEKTEVEIEVENTEIEVEVENTEEAEK